VASERTADEIQADIEQARASLAVAVDQLAVRTSPKRLGDQIKQAIIAKAKSPQGQAVIAGTGAVVLILVVRRVRRR